MSAGYFCPEITCILSYLSYFILSHTHTPCVIIVLGDIPSEHISLIITDHR